MERQSPEFKPPNEVPTKEDQEGLLATTQALHQEALKVSGIEEQVLRDNGIEPFDGDVLIPIHTHIMRRHKEGEGIDIEKIYMVLTWKTYEYSQGEWQEIDNRKEVSLVQRGIDELGHIEDVGINGNLEPEQRKIVVDMADELSDLKQTGWLPNLADNYEQIAMPTRSG